MVDKWERLNHDGVNQPSQLLLCAKLVALLKNQLLKSLRQLSLKNH